MNSDCVIAPQTPTTLPQPYAQAAAIHLIKSILYVNVALAARLLFSS